VACPFHEDHTPSLHAFPEPAQGWFCFGPLRPRRLDLRPRGAAAGYNTRGPDFVRLKAKLRQRLDLYKSD
jgi:hypothetical protein